MMALFGPSREMTALERRVDKLEDAQAYHFDKVEGLLEEIRDEAKRHAERANGHPAKIIWHGMTWPQIIGIGMLLAILALVGFDSFELVRIAGQQAAQAAESVAPAMAGLF